MTTKIQMTIPESARCPRCGPPRHTKLQWQNAMHGPTSTEPGFVCRLVAHCDCEIAWASSPVFHLPQFFTNTNITEF